MDFSDQSQHALRWAVALAVRFDARLIVFTAVDPLLAEAARVRARVDLAKTEVQPALREFVRAVIPAAWTWAPQPALDLREGDGAEETLAAAARHNADLVVMGTQGLGGFRKLILGSTTERVLRRTRTPVLAVPPETTGAVAIDGAGVRLALERLLLATDFGAAADAALRWASSAARTLDVPLVLAHVVPETNVPSQWRAYAAESDEERVAEARRRLERLGRDCGAAKCEIVVDIGRPADSIGSIAQEHRAGLIVLGLAGEHGPFARRPGSIAYPILCRAHVPVVVVPAP